METTLSSETVFEGRIFRVRVDTVRLTDGKTAVREVVEHPGAAAVLPLDGQGRVLLVSQFRKPVEEVLWEIPAGKLEAGEDPWDCARRELEEETGYKCQQLEHLMSFYSSPGFSNEKIYVFLASGLTPGVPGGDEKVELVPLELAEALAAIRSGQIRDAKTIAALLALQVRRLEEQCRSL